VPFEVGGWGIAKRRPSGGISWGTTSLCPSHPFYFFNGLPIWHGACRFTR
jgi:hypothetical protein